MIVEPTKQEKEHAMTKDALLGNALMILIQKNNQKNVYMIVLMENV